MRFQREGGMMKQAEKKQNHAQFANFMPIGVGMIILMLMAGCSADYGRLKRDLQVQQAFESQQVPPGYTYYYYGYSSKPYVVFGIEPKYKMSSKFWKEVAPNTDEFKEMIRWIWEDYGYHKFGSDILDPAEKKVGIMYTAITPTSVKFGADNQIEVIPSAPFLWGPDGGKGGGIRVF
jgi:hypothetical protein